MSDQGVFPRVSSRLVRQWVAVSEYEDIVAAVVAGKHQVEVEHIDFSYGVYANGRRVICFAEGRIGDREWARRSGRLGEIHSLDDRYDHEIDELTA